MKTNLQNIYIKDKNAKHLLDKSKKKCFYEKFYIEKRSPVILFYFCLKDLYPSS